MYLSQILSNGLDTTASLKTKNVNKVLRNHQHVIQRIRMSYILFIILILIQVMRLIYIKADGLFVYSFIFYKN